MTVLGFLAPGKVLLNDIPKCCGTSDIYKMIRLYGEETQSVVFLLEVIIYITPNCEYGDSNLDRLGCISLSQPPRYASVHNDIYGYSNASPTLLQDQERVTLLLSRLI
jgi:hypothetical protein